MKVFGKICLIAVVVAFAGASFAQTVLVNQAPNGVNGFFSDSDLENFGGVPQSSATGFQIGADAMLTRTIIWGLYLPGSAAAPPSFTVSVRDGGSLEIVNGGTAIDTRNAGLTVTGNDLFGFPELRVSINHEDFALAAGAYWIEVFNATPAGTDDWAWETGNFDPVNGFDPVNPDVGTNIFSGTAPGVDWFVSSAPDNSVLTLAMQLLEDDPLLVTMESFEGRMTRRGAVKLEWNTASEENNAGFHVIRRTYSREKGSRTLVLTESLIPAMGNTLEGASYSFVDPAPEAGRNHYFVVDYDLDGRSQEHGPVVIDTRGQLSIGGSRGNAAPAVPYRSR